VWECVVALFWNTLRDYSQTGFGSDYLCFNFLLPAGSYSSRSNQLSFLVSNLAVELKNKLLERDMVTDLKHFLWRKKRMILVNFKHLY